jgi:muramidase (phage lysozyme)
LDSIRIPFFPAPGSFCRQQIGSFMDANLKSFLDLIAWSEGTSTSRVTQNNGYDVIVSGVEGPSIFTSYADHPFADGRSPVVIRINPPLSSTAAGRYQVLVHWWQAYKTMLHLPDFSPDSQDLVAIQQIRERQALPMIEAGNIAGAISACCSIWASLPGNNYGQAGGHTLQALLVQYNTLAGASRLGSEPLTA